MNANAVYSKSGKGVQEASGKTSHLSRPDRSVLSAIDGRATLAEVAAKVGKTFDPAFEKLIETLDKGGFVREVSPGTAAPAKPGAAAKPGAKPGAGAPMDAVSDLDFTAAMSAPKSKSPVPPPQALKATPPPAKHTATIPPPPPPPSASEKAQAAKSAKEQQDAFAKARAEAEEKAAAERERAKAEAEAKIRAETEAKMRAESADTQKKHAAEAEAKIKAAAEAKAKADAEAKKAREEAERTRKEAEDTTRREREEFNRKLEQERKAREEAERKAKEEAKRLEEERRKLEEERKREEAERAERRKREEQEAEERRRKREEEEERERAEREAKREAERAERKRQEQEEEEREKAQKAMRDARRKMEQRKEEEEEEKRRAERKKRDPDEPEEEEKPKAKPKKAPEPEPSQPAGGGISDSLLADLDSFTNREEEDRKAQEEEERKKKEEAARRAREAEERRAKEEAEREEREEKERRKQEEKERKARDEAELRERDEKEKKRLKDEEEKRKKEAEEREKKSKQDERLTANATRATGYDADAERRSKRERELGPKPKAGAAAAHAEKKGGLGKTLVLGLLGLMVVAVGIAHVMPIDTADYERAATEALGRQVKIGSARLSLFSGLLVKFSGVAVGDDVKIAEVRGYLGIGALTAPKKDFSRIEIDGAKIDQRAVGTALFVRVKADNFSVGRIVAKQIEFPGPLVLPKGLDLEINYDAQGAVQSAVVRGPEALVAKLAPKGSSIEVDMSASSFTLPFAPEISLSKFGLKGSTTPRGLAVSEWDGSAYGGTLAGTANVIWGDTWVVDGVVTARNLNAAVFAPALLSEGKGDGSGKFSMRGQPGKLADAARIDGTFTVSRGVLGSIDLSRAIQTGGKQATGRTQFNEMNGQGVYDRGAVALRNVTLSAGLLNAGASVDIAQSGALSGRIVADVKVQRATLNLGGTIKEPQVRN